jgi:cytochrome o ubiquinol oxidase subunit 3
MAAQTDMNTAPGDSGDLLARYRARLREEREYGFWLYLMSDAVIFALLFATYVVMVGRTAGGPSPGAMFHLPHTFYETACLLVSTLTFAFARGAAGEGRRGVVLAWLAVTFVLGLGFVNLEWTEFGDMIANGAGPDRSGSLSAFFTLVGTHGLHVSAGLVWIAVMAAELTANGVTAAAESRLERLGMFWHFLDVVWVAIISVVYLPGVMK